jgi:hypothetical protein
MPWDCNWSLECNTTRPLLACNVIPRGRYPWLQTWPAVVQSHLSTRKSQGISLGTSTKCLGIAIEALSATPQGLYWLATWYQDHIPLTVWLYTQSQSTPTSGNQYLKSSGHGCHRLVLPKYVRRWCNVCAPRANRKFCILALSASYNSSILQ